MSSSELENVNDVYLFGQDVPGTGQVVWDVENNPSDL